MPNFSNLLNKVLEGTATDTEYQQFEQMARSGKYDKQLTGEALSKQKLQDSELWPRMTTRVYEKIEPDIQLEKRIVLLEHSRNWLAAAAVILILMVAGAWFIAKDGNWFNPSATPQKTNLARFVDKQVVDLPDGTKVILNASSELNYTRPFNREVTLIGEATFDVTHDPAKPFLVHTGKITTKVLGTEFNIHAYPSENQVTVTVLRGLVEVGDEKKVYGQIKPNERIAVDVQSLDFVQEKTNAEEAVSWKANFLILDEVDLEQAASLIGEKFNVKITLENPELKNCRIMARFMNDESLETVLSVIGRVIDVQYAMEKDGSVTLKGKGCN